MFRKKYIYKTPFGIKIKWGENKKHKCKEEEKLLKKNIRPDKKNNNNNKNNKKQQQNDLKDWFCF